MEKPSSAEDVVVFDDSAEGATLVDELRRLGTSAKIASHWSETDLVPRLAVLAVDSAEDKVRAATHAAHMPTTRFVYIGDSTALSEGAPLVPPGPVYPRPLDIGRAAAHISELVHSSGRASDGPPKTGARPSFGIADEATGGDLEQFLEESAAIEEAPRLSPDLVKLLDRAANRVSAMAAAPSPSQAAPAEVVIPPEILLSLSAPLDPDAPAPETHEGDPMTDTYAGGDIFRTSAEWLHHLTESEAIATREAQATVPWSAPANGEPPTASSPAEDEADATPTPVPPGHLPPQTLAFSVPPYAQPALTHLAPPRASAFVSARAAMPEPRNPAEALAQAISARESGVLTLRATTTLFRVVLREGDVVTVTSDDPGDSLLSFLVERGDVDPKLAESLAPKVPHGGRHAGAALIAQGVVPHDDLWIVLRGYAEWLLCRILRKESVASFVDPSPPGWLAQEPNVFGGATGGEIFVEAVRRTFSRNEALARLGGEHTRLVPGTQTTLLGECALPQEEEEILRNLHVRSVEDLSAQSALDEFPVILFALTELGVLKAEPSSMGSAPPTAHIADRPATDDDAIRNRIAARAKLVADGDYFAILGVPRGASAYEIRRAFIELRRQMDASRILSARLADLTPQVDAILEVAEEAYFVLRDETRRERYRRALLETASESATNT